MNDMEGQKKIRPWFLTVLCYLTIFWSSFMLVSALSSLSNLDQAVMMMSQSMDRAQSMFETTMGNDPAAMDKLDELMGHIRSANTSSNMRDHYVFMVVVSLLTLVGANLMLRLKKNGFRLYVLGNIIGVVAPLLVFGGGNFLGFAYALSGALTGAIFILLYALKIRYMD